MGNAFAVCLPPPPPDAVDRPPFPSAGRAASFPFTLNTLEGFLETAPGDHIPGGQVGSGRLPAGSPRAAAENKTSADVSSNGKEKDDDPRVTLRADDWCWGQCWLHGYWAAVLVCAVALVVLPLTRRSPEKVLPGQQTVRPAQQPSTKQMWLVCNTVRYLRTIHFTPFTTGEKILQTAQAPCEPGIRPD